MSSLSNFVNEPINLDELKSVIDSLERSLSELDGQLRRWKSSGQEDRFQTGHAESLDGNAKLAALKTLYRILARLPEPEAQTILAKPMEMRANLPRNKGD